MPLQSLPPPLSPRNEHKIITHHYLPHFSDYIVCMTSRMNLQQDKCIISSLSAFKYADQIYLHTHRMRERGRERPIVWYFDELIIVQESYNHAGKGRKLGQLHLPNNHLPVLDFVFKLLFATIQTTQGFCLIFTEEIHSWNMIYKKSPCSVLSLLFLSFYS